MFCQRSCRKFTPVEKSKKTHQTMTRLYRRRRKKKNRIGYHLPAFLQFITTAFKWVFTIALLAVIPGFVVQVGWMLREIIWEYSMHSADPEFSYLFSGLLLQQGNINLFTDHPGTPLIVLASIVIRSAFHVRSADRLVDDVMLLPDYYLHNMNVALFTGVAVIIFISGVLYYWKTRNLSTAVFLQFSPFIAEPVYSSFERFMPETFLVGWVVLVFFVVALDTHRLMHPGPVFRSRGVIYGIIMGLGLSVKFTMMPFLIIPLFMLQENKKRLTYGIAAIIAFLIFTFPLLKRAGSFFNWIKSIVIHSGKYGSGDADFLNLAEFYRNLSEIFSKQPMFLITLIIAGVILLFRNSKLIKENLTNDRYIDALKAVSATLLVGILIISKHYAHYYLIPYQMLVVFIYFIVVRIFLDLIKRRNRLTESALYLVFILFALVLPKGLPQFLRYAKIKAERTEVKREIRREVKEITDKGGVVVLSPEYWHTRPEAGLFFATVMTPSGSKEFGSVLNWLYPRTFFYKWNQDQLYDWFDMPHPPEGMINHHREVLLLIRNDDPAFIHRSKQIWEATGIANLERVYEHSNPTYLVYRVTHKDLQEEIQGFSETEKSP
jgi:hypothetical protein